MVVLPRAFPAADRLPALVVPVRRVVPAVLRPVPRLPAATEPIQSSGRATARVGSTDARVLMHAGVLLHGFCWGLNVAGLACADDWICSMKNSLSMRTAAATGRSRSGMVKWYSTSTVEEPSLQL